jgi:hydroxymethylpyrimidine pyrophosphatase-like HAD family hydrolase
VIATIRPHEKTVDRVIEELNLNMEVAFNRESVMVLPSGVGKASGLLAALLRLNLNPDGVVGIGDAENDEPFLRLCGVSVAVANAIESLKDQVDLVTTHEAGAGSAEIIRRIMSGKNLI